MTIEAGKWYRTPEGQPVRSRGHVWKTSAIWAMTDRVHVEGIDGHRWTWPAKQLTEWVPKVGEWVTVTNRDDPGPVRVLRVIEDLAYFSEELLACAGYFRGGGGDPHAMRVEPCLPPAEKIEPAQTTTTTTWNEAGGAIVPGSVRAVAMTSGGIATAVGANGSCPRCGGPAYVGLNDAECLAEKCERAEPEPTIDIVSVGRYECGYQAFGAGVCIRHPIRDEAIRLWREAVRQ